MSIPLHQTKVTTSDLGNFWRYGGEGWEERFCKGEGPSCIRPKSPLSKAVFFFWATNLCHLELSCNDAGSQGLTWRLASLTKALEPDPWSDSLSAQGLTIEFRVCHSCLLFHLL